MKDLMIIRELILLVLFLQHQDESEAEEARETQESRLAKIEALLQELAQRTEVLDFITWS